MPILSCNIAQISVTESAANTLTYKKLESGISTLEKIAWRVHMIAYEFIGALLSSIFGTNADALDIALTASNAVTDLQDLSNPSILDHMFIRRIDLGTAASGHFYFQPVTKDFSALPGGGLLVPAAPLFLGAKGTGLEGAATARVRVYYSPEDLKADDFWQLLEMYRMISS